MTLATFLRRLGLLGIVAALLALPASASALQFHIVNESGRSANEVFVTVVVPAGKPFDVPGFNSDEPRRLSEIPGGELTVNQLISGRVYVSYGAPVRERHEEGKSDSELASPGSPTRYDWAELTVTPKPEDAANLTAVNQFAIGMRLTTFGENGEQLQTVGSTYANTLFDALQGIPGGPESTVRAANGEILRVLSPDNVGSHYPLLTEYVNSMEGQTITLHAPFFIENGRTTSVYSGTFGAEGAITLTGTKRIEGAKPVEATPIVIPAGQLAGEIYTDTETPNDLEGEVRHDLLAGFSLGLWGGKYGNDAINFCTEKQSNTLGEWCPSFNVPAYAEARTTPAPFTAYEQYAAVISQYTDIYGNPFTDASKKVTVELGQPPVKTLQLSILPDSPPAPSGPSGGGGSGSGNSSNSPAPAPPTSKPKTPPLSQVTFKLPKKAKLAKGKIKAGRLVCDGACGRVVAILRPKKGKGVIAREAVTDRTAKGLLVLKPTKFGKRLLAHKRAVPAKLTVTVTQPGHRSATKVTPLRVLR
jgi:hypothetical protein